MIATVGRTPVATSSSSFRVERREEGDKAVKDCDEDVSLDVDDGEKLNEPEVAAGALMAQLCCFDDSLAGELSFFSSSLSSAKEGRCFGSRCQHETSKLLKPKGHDLSNLGLSPPCTTTRMKSSLDIPLKGTLSRAICHNIIPKL